MFPTHTEYKHEFGTGIGEKIVAHSFDNVDLIMSDLNGNIDSLIVTNLSQVPELGHNLLSTILLARKGIEVFLRKAGQPSEIIVDEKIFALANIIENQYDIR